jgi:NADH-quinone oxidoreductase subunit B
LAANRTIAIEGNESGFATSRVDAMLNWARKYSLFQYPFVTACCGMEFMSLASPRFDLARFGAEAPRFSPRQADLLWVVGTISQRQAPVLRRIYEQMMDPKWVLAFGTCASCGGFYDNYTTLAGIDKIIPCDIYVPGCPPRPEAVMDGLLLLQDKIARGDRTPGIVKPREDPLVKLRTRRGDAPLPAADAAPGALVPILSPAVPSRDEQEEDEEEGEEEDAEGEEGEEEEEEGEEDETDEDEEDAK